MTSGSSNENAKLIHLDAVGGVAGDMFVAALLDALPSFRERVLNDVRAVLPKEIGRPVLLQGMAGGVRCLRFGLSADTDPKFHHREADHAHHAHHDDLDHHHAHDSAACVTHARTTDFVSLRQRIQAADLAAGTADEAVGILTVLARAEATIHGVGIEDVHFHEVGDWDSLMDVVAAGSIAAALRPAHWSISELPRGGGFVLTQHGLLPVPAPATLEILKGFRWRDDGVGGERVTPTGAAIIRHLCSPSCAAVGSFDTLSGSGYGAGTRELTAMPNILRATVYEPSETAHADMVEVLTFDVDDMTGEEIGVSADRLRTATGVIDLTLQQITGKKGRPVMRFQLLANPACVDDVCRAVFLETSTLGLRRQREERRILARHETTRAGRRAKVAARPGGTRTLKLESDELAGIAGLAARRAIARQAEEDADD